MRRIVLIPGLMALGLGIAFYATVRLVYGPIPAPPPPQAPDRPRPRPATPAPPPGFPPLSSFQAVDTHGPSRYGPPFIPATTMARTRPVPEHGYRDLPHALADATARAMGRWLGRAAKATPVDADVLAYRIAWNGGGADVVLATHPWAAQDWIPGARAMLGKAVGGAADTGDTARALLEPIPAVLLRADAEAGARLAAEPRDPAAHERAALVAAVFAMREAAGPFSDRSGSLARACAHLALARAGGAGDGTSGRVATALVEALVGRELSAIALADAWPKEDPILAAWRRAVRLRAGLDWKADGATPGASLAEQLAHVRALAVRLSATEALEWLDSHPHAPLADWCRLACEAPRLSVEDGHVCARGALPEEGEEIAAVLPVVLGRPRAPGDLARLAATVDPDADRTRVMPPADWAGFLARHLLAHLGSAHDFAADHWGVPEEAARVRAFAGQVGDLEQLPFLRAGWSDEPERAAAIAAADRILAEHPERVPPGLWARLAAAHGGNPGTALSVKPLPWLISLAPHGTTWGIAGSCAVLGGWWDYVPAWGEVLALAPRNPWVARSLVQRCLSSGREAIAQPVIARLRGIDYNLLHDAAHASRGDARIDLLRDLATLDSDAWIELGDNLAWVHRDAEAAEAYDRGFAEARDSVMVSNSMRWWVDWLLDHGRRDRAREVATRCREVFSSRGLQTFARFCERTGDPDAAEQALKDLAERYDRRTHLVAFYARTAATRPASRDALAAEERTVFPQGRTTVTRAELTSDGPGTVFSNPPAPLHAAGLGSGQTILAVDGVRCRNVAQYDFMYNNHREGPLILLVWGKDGCRELRVTDPDLPAAPLLPAPAPGTTPH